MTHTAVPEAEKRALGVMPGGCRISLGLEDRHDIIRDLEAGLEQV
jgi:cystathionine beta-lyase/cystathionine gamma-synthase